MSYTKHNWVNGETITDTLLNHLEDGVNSALTTFKINVTYNLDTEEATCDKTFAQIMEAYNNNFTLMLEEVTILEDDRNDANIVNIPLLKYFESEQEWPASFKFEGVGLINGAEKHINLSVYDDEENPIYFELGNVSIYNEVTVVFTNSGYNYSIYGITVTSAEGEKSISVEEYLKSDFIQYKAIIDGADFRYMQMLTPASFLDFDLAQVQGRLIAVVRNVVIDSEGNVSAEAVYFPTPVN